MKNSTGGLLAAILCAPILIGAVLYVTKGSPDTAPFAPPPQKRIGAVRIFNEIMQSEEVVRQLRELREDNSISGVIVRIESPGGAVAPSQEIFAEVLKYRETGKPLVVSMGSVAASGGYYIASAAQKIFANAGTITGSIGVIFRFPQFSKLFDKVGVSMETIKSGTYKDVGSPDRALTMRERNYLQQFLDDTYEQFLSDVAMARSMDLQSIRLLADGRIYTGNQARASGLIDSIGTYQEALAYLKEACGLPEKTRVIEKKRHATRLHEILTEEIFDRIPLLRTGRRKPGVYYLFEPF